MRLEIRNLADPDQIKEFPKGKVEMVSAGGVTVGRVRYEPGWKWSEHVGAETGAKSCQVEHVVLVVSGRMAIVMDDGTEVEVGPGDVCAIPPGHDAWVLGDEPYVSLHFHGTEEYAVP